MSNYAYKKIARPVRVWRCGYCILTMEVLGDSHQVYVSVVNCWFTTELTCSLSISYANHATSGFLRKHAPHHILRMPVSSSSLR